MLPFTSIKLQLCSPMSVNYKDYHKGCVCLCYHLQSSRGIKLPCSLPLIPEYLKSIRTETPWSYSPSYLVSVPSGTPCLICGRAEEVRADAVCFTPTATTTARRSGSWWMLQPRTSLNTNIIQTLTDVRPLHAALFSFWPGFQTYPHYFTILTPITFSFK